MHPCYCPSAICSLSNNCAFALCFFLTLPRPSRYGPNFLAVYGHIDLGQFDLYFISFIGWDKRWIDGIGDMCYSLNGESRLLLGQMKRNSCLLIDPTPLLVIVGYASKPCFKHRSKDKAAKTISLLADSLRIQMRPLMLNLLLGLFSTILFLMQLLAARPRQAVCSKSTSADLFLFGSQYLNNVSEHQNTVCLKINKKATNRC